MKKLLTMAGVALMLTMAMATSARSDYTVISSNPAVAHVAEVLLSRRSCPAAYWMTAWRNGMRAGS